MLRHRYSNREIKILLAERGKQKLSTANIDQLSVVLSTTTTKTSRILEEAWQSHNNNWNAMCIHVFIIHTHCRYSFSRSVLNGAAFHCPSWAEQPLALTIFCVFLSSQRPLPASPCHSAPPHTVCRCWMRKRVSKFGIPNRLEWRIPSASGLPLPRASPLLRTTIVRRHIYILYTYTFPCCIFGILTRSAFAPFKFIIVEYY